MTASETCEVEKKVGKWEEMLVVFYRNYVMWFQGTKESLRPDDYPKGYVRLDKSRLENIRVREDVSGIWPKREEVQNCFGVFHTEVKDSFGVFRCHSSSQYDRMYGHLGKYMSEVQRAAKDLHRFGNDLDKLVKVVKMPMRLECNVNGSRVKEWTEKMVGLRDLYKEWSPNLQV